MIKVCILGSSLCRDLRKFDHFKTRFIAGHWVQFIYRPFSGKSYEHFLSNPQEIDWVLRCRPDYVITILGANSIKTTVSTETLYDNAWHFYDLLHSKLQAVNSRAKIIVHQIPLRFVTNGFKNCPDPDTFKETRDKLNEKIRKFKTKQHVLLIAGPSKLDHRDLFKKDGTHFNRAGLNIQLNCIIAKFEHLLK